MKKIESVEEIQTISIGILEYIRSVCEKYNITFYLDSGTALGAIRHKGFIPWDDDEDILMMREEYQKFIKAMDLENHPYYKLFSVETLKDYNLPIAKVVDIRTELKQRKQNEKIRLGIYVDLFVCDSIPDKQSEVYKLMRDQKKYQDLWVFFQYKVLNIRNVRSFVHWLLQKIMCPFNIQRVFAIKLEKLAMSSDCKNTLRIGTLNYIIYRDKVIMPREWYKDFYEAEFEGIMYKLPAKYDEYLRFLYGNYMELPPEEARVSHHDTEIVWKDVY